MDEPGRILAVDFGDKRTGLAICEESGRIVTPYEVIIEEDGPTLAKRIAQVANAEDVGLILLGLPLDMDGRVGGRAIITENFGKLLIAELGERPLKYEDERLTSFAAESLLATTGLSRRKMKGRVDSIAACEILRSYLGREFPESQATPDSMSEDMPWEKQSFDSRRRNRRSR